MSRLSRLLTTADQAIARIESGMTIASGGFVGAAHPETLSAALERRFHSTGEPRDLTLVYAAGQGDGRERGLNHLAHPGLLRRVIGGHWGLVPRLGKMAIDEQIEAYNFPQGVICQLYRDIAAGRPGCITHVGLDTFVDPLAQGGRLNQRSHDALVERVRLADRDWLFYRAFPIHVALLRATAADPFGNLLMDEEAVIGDVLPLAQAAHNHRGIVIAQVRELREQPAAPQQVRVPGVLVDHIVVAGEGEHDQTFAERSNPTYYRPQDSAINTVLAPLTNGPRRWIAERACELLRPGDIANLGIGMPEGIARIAAERGLLDAVTLTLESGPIGGMPAGGLSFGASVHPQAIIDQPAQFDFYDGGGLDFAALGAAEIDTAGNVNVAKFGRKLAGVGGFINISQNARTLVFCGTFTSDGLEMMVNRGEMNIVREGSVRKFVPRVEQISFNAPAAYRRGQAVWYITERAVFRLLADGLQLVEVAPGIDIERDILAQMGFRPMIGPITPMRLHEPSSV